MSSERPGTCFLLYPEMGEHQAGAEAHGGSFGQPAYMNMRVHGKYHQGAKFYSTGEVEGRGDNGFTIGGPYLQVRLVIVIWWRRQLNGRLILVILYAWWCWDAWGVLMLSMKQQA